MASMKQILNCIGLSGEVSLIYDFFGYPIPPTLSLSLLQQVQRLKDKYINLNMYEMGPDLYTGKEYLYIADAILGTREIYAREANLGIGRITHTAIPSAAAPNRVTMDNDAETITLANEYTFSTDGINVFFVQVYISENNFIGISDVGGTCAAPVAGSRNGAIVSLQALEATYYVLAHELGHYLGLCHANESTCDTKNDNPLNLMISRGVKDPVSLEKNQVDTMRAHCFVKAGCT
jgi:Metallo-peptidase family M12B Reprolysin-like